MKIYDDPLAPNPRRVRIFVKEKGLDDIEFETLHIAKSAHKSPEFLKKNPLGLLPVLELDDGTCISESVAICRYLEELHPEPNLMGETPLERAQIEVWARRMEIELMNYVAGYFRNTHPFWQGRIPQVPEWGEICKKAALKRMEWLDSELAEREFIACDRFTIADITALVGLDFGRITKLWPQPQFENLTRWHAAVSARPSTKG